MAQSENRTLSEWLLFFNEKYSKSQIYSFCYRNNISVKKISKQEKSLVQSQNSRKWHINKDYFKTWNGNMAYVLGFWFADGCIYRGRLFDITVSKKDKYIVKKIKDELQYEGPISDYVDRQACRINFSCKVIYDDIVKLGGMERKSLEISFPNVPKEYLSDFIRGYFDGDGCIRNLKNNRVILAFTSGSKKFLNSLLSILKQECQVVGGSYDASSQSLRFGKRDSIKIGEYMYKNNPKLFLLRKREKFNFFYKRKNK